MKTTHVSQKALIFNSRGEVLVLFRTETAPTRPNAWDLPGGELEFGEKPAEGMIREIQEEAGLAVEAVRVFHIESSVSPENEFWVLITYAAQAISEAVTLSYEHNQFKWVTPSEFMMMSTSDRQKRALEIYLAQKIRR